MRTPFLACAALLLASCGGAASPTAADKASEKRTGIRFSERIELVKPDTTAGLSINRALQNRRSWREYSPEQLSLEELSGVLWAAAGINRPADDHLTAPSALALYPLRVYAFFAEGIYRYDARSQALERVAGGDHRAVAGAQPFVATAPLNLVYVADLEVYERRSMPAEQARYLAGQDAAGYAENVNLYTAGHGLRSITRGSASPELLGTLGLDPERYFFALAQSVGK
ncbi:nitroreductase family protein [Alistipes sp.]|uniref:nitroreductase family protein n=1 Tax=Alistipes sp. TaxID=1872444 RepID=UPI003AF17CA8